MQMTFTGNSHAHEALVEAAVGVPQSTVSPDLEGNLRDETADGRESLDSGTVGAGPRASWAPCPIRLTSASQNLEKFYFVLSANTGNCQR